eukprot:gene18296-15360_t
MLFKPVTYPQGYGFKPNKTTWGGNVLEDVSGKTGYRYHLFASAMTNGCGLGAWSSNSRVEHAVSAEPTGPFLFKDVAINTWAHNTAPIALPGNAGYAIVHIGKGVGKPDGGKNCTTHSSDPYSSSLYSSSSSIGTLLSVPPTAAGDAAANAKPPAGSRIHVSPSLDGPWVPLLNDTLPQDDCDNPSPWVHPNGTFFLACGRQIKGNYIHLWRSENIWGPWINVSEMRPPNMAPSGPPGKWEDEFVYTDHRGNFHALWHAFDLSEKERKSCTNSTVSAHTFSLDGINWHASETQPYTTQVATAPLASPPWATADRIESNLVTVSTRERPKLLFNSSGHMTHLVNGVSGAPQCGDDVKPPHACANCKLKYWDYTLIAPLDV